MAYPDDLLGEGEHVLLHRHPHWRMLVRPFVVLLVVGVGGGYLAVLAASGPWRTTLWGALGVIGGVLLIWLVLTPLLRWWTTHFVVTTQRLMVREGVITRSGVHIPVDRINSVRSRRGLLDRLLGSGTLIVESASDEPLEFDDISDVDRVQSLLYGTLDEDSEGGHPAG
ncbi:putative membrane protein YdbT with pleckstrin-like domain [Actinopolyspora biskrensis]|uniref:Putative membrane protein YdbT with pleckstrin-like domain n=1 Tax=Actinopolyspora biskrensis TaxID=1470178 RepID=A0A852Z714_9ACTN|nr:PH domain-containing protein [Actinopolyspora biskrensis]NYH79356.1 putative membrane protein YdbT with pleckstrin-like domain [Actinopolyspora biskrensis]